MVDELIDLCDIAIERCNVVRGKFPLCGFLQIRFEFSYGIRIFPFNGVDECIVEIDEIESQGVAVGMRFQ